MLHAHAPRLGPHLREHFHHAGRSQRDAIRPDMTKRIVSVRLRRIGSIKVDDIQQPFRLECDRRSARPRSPCGSISANPFPRSKSCSAIALHQCRFAGAGLADDVDVREAIFPLYAERPLAVAKICFAEIRDIVRLGHPATILTTRTLRTTRVFARTANTRVDRARPLSCLSGTDASLGRDCTASKMADRQY